jgi:hypothetical protein
VVPVQRAALDAEHSPQAPLGWQTGVFPPHSLSPAQARQIWVPRSQTGAVPEHWPLLVHATQIPGPRSQTDVVPVQRVALVAEHCPQAPLS